MQTSGRGRAFLRGHEGDVLKAYRCPAGRWTIGVGLTAASGVVVPKAGMTITAAESDHLLSKALSRNYEPRVVKAMPDAEQHEFDAGTSFDFNTGAIHRATWVEKWRANASVAVIAAGLAQWTKGGGKVLPGLVRRRKEEADIINFNQWPSWTGKQPDAPNVAFAVFVVSMTEAEIAEVEKGFRLLGYDTGKQPGRIALGPVVDFQKKHNLTVDGRIGTATLSTLQRELDARNRAIVVGGGTVAGGSTVATGEAVAPSPDQVGGLSDAALAWIGYAALGAVAIYGLYLAWHYRDVIAARLQGVLPARVTAWLRSF